MRVVELGVLVLRPVPALGIQLEAGPRDALVHRVRLGDVAEGVLVAPDDERRRSRQLRQALGPQEVALADLHVLEAEQVVDVRAGTPAVW